MRNRIFLLLVIGIGHVTGLWSQTDKSDNLPRRAFFGVQMEPVTDDVQRVMQLPDLKGVLIQRVVPGSTAEAAGLKQGDVLLELDGQPVNTPDEAVRKVGKFRAGQTLSYKLLRDGKTIHEKTAIQGLPGETYTDLELTYGSVKTGNVLLRTIVTHPKNSKGKLPALLFVQGIGCYTMDTPFDTARTELQLINRLAREGWTVMRVDKSGIGDSQGTPCEQIDFNTELSGYEAAFASMQQLEQVDTNNCFLFGHSMGGVMAPLIAKKYPVKGIVAYGTIGVNFMEYFINSRRTIAASYFMTPEEMDDYIKEQTDCTAMLLSARLSKDQAMAINPNCGAVYDALLFRSIDFWRQLYAMNIPSNWQYFKGHVMAAWGETDFIANKEEHQYIAEIVNQTYPGNGTFVEIQNSDHGMHMAATLQEARTNPGGFNPEVFQIVGNWLKTQAGKDISVKSENSTKKEQVLLWMDGVENAYPRASADGSRILFQSNRSGKWHLYLMQSDGSGLQQLTAGEHNNNFPDWSTDGQRVAFVSDRDGNEEIYIMSLTEMNNGEVKVGDVQRLTHHAGRDIHPYFSQDGKSLLFNSSRDDTNSFEIYHMDSDGKNQKRLTQTREVETCARYSPDGKKILFLKGFPDGSDDIFVMDADGKKPVNLTNTPQMEGWPAWSPDGSKVVFSSRRNGPYRLYEMDKDGENVQQISFTESPLYDARASYMGNGNRILFNRQKGNTIGIYVLER
jgi:Tol biopolymer transport system component/pimeloyl-ACP methyl ester carboxylesterase